MSVKKAILILALFSLPALVFANGFEIRYAPTFVGSLNLADIQYCENH